jgi:hypothetical protein
MCVSGSEFVSYLNKSSAVCVSLRASATLPKLLMEPVCFGFICNVHTHISVLVYFLMIALTAGCNYAFDPNGLQLWAATIDCNYGLQLWAATMGCNYVFDPNGWSGGLYA